jgi:hypothetical protein
VRYLCVAVLYNIDAASSHFIPLYNTTSISGIAQHALLYLTVTAIYYFLVLLGGQFYTFQWDVLLIETGFLTALCFAPWQSLNLRKEDITTTTTVGCWPLRFLLFKLMFMSGIVKVQAECPTWENLTALEFHFATQCVSSHHQYSCPDFLCIQYILNFLPLCISKNSFLDH